MKFFKKKITDYNFMDCMAGCIVSCLLVILPLAAIGIGEKIKEKITKTKTKAN